MSDKPGRVGPRFGKASSRVDESVKRLSRNSLDEHWLERKVRDMYQEVVDEPVPDDILNILNRIPKLDP